MIYQHIADFMRKFRQYSQMREIGREMDEVLWMLFWYLEGFSNF